MLRLVDQKRPLSPGTPKPTPRSAGYCGDRCIRRHRTEVRGAVSSPTPGRNLSQPSPSRTQPDRVTIASLQLLPKKQQLTAALNAAAASCRMHRCRRRRHRHRWGQARLLMPHRALRRRRHQVAYDTNPASSSAKSRKPRRLAAQRRLCLRRRPLQPLWSEVSCHRQMSRKMRKSRSQARSL